MTCASCAIPIKAALKKVEGVKEVEVKYNEKKAYVVYDPAVTTPETLAEAVNKTKIFSATLPEKEEEVGGGGREERK
jgi:copper chaperone CopZ